MSGPGPAARRWAAALAGWAIPDEILAAAPESPWGCPPELFRAPDPGAGGDPPSRRRALEALAAAGPQATVLDVGVGAGGASLPLCPPAVHVTGVDESQSMLEAFAADAARRGVAAATVEGTWPEVAAGAPVADVVVCHHVFYNVADLAPFALALGAHARRRVVCELTAEHPLVPLGPLWRHFHGIDRPSGPTAPDAAAVLAECGIAATVERFERPARWGPELRAAQVAFTRRRLCLTPDRDAEIDALLPAEPPPRGVATIWWETAGNR